MLSQYSPWDHSRVDKNSSLVSKKERKKKNAKMQGDETRSAVGQANLAHLPVNRGGFSGFRRKERRCKLRWCDGLREMLGGGEWYSQ